MKNYMKSILALLMLLPGIAWADNVAKIGDTCYETLQAALDAAHETTGDVTVELIANTSGYSVVHQKAGLNLTIDGKNNTLGGQIIIDGDGRASGTFTDDVKAFVAEGYALSDNGDGTLSVNELPDVAMIGETAYKSLADAIAAVPVDGTETTITMIANEKISVIGYALTVAVNKNVVLDLNGHQVVGTCESSSTSALIRNLGTLTIQDSSDTHADGTGDGKLIAGASSTWTWDGSDNYVGSYASNLIRNEGTLTVNSGFLNNISIGSAAYTIDNYTAGNVTARTIWKS